jgi:hypothetical protein
METRYEVLFPVVRANHLDIGICKPGLAQPLRHGLCGGRHISDRVGGVDLDQLFQDVARELVRVFIRLRR